MYRYTKAKQLRCQAVIFELNRTEVQMSTPFWEFDRWQWKRDVSIKRSNFKDTRQKISVPLADEHKSSKKKFQSFQKPRKK